MEIFNDTEVIILAAGKGTRMKSDLPKALTPLNGKPFLAHILNTLRSLNSDLSPIIVIGHNGEMIKEAMGGEYRYAVQGEQLGTGHAVMTAKPYIRSNTKSIFVISGDQPLISPDTIIEMMSVHRTRSATVTMATISIPDFLDWREGLAKFGRIIRNDKKEVLDIVEFKDATEEERNGKELNLAIYVFDSSWLWENINKLENKNVQGEYYLTDMVKMAVESGKMVETVEVKNSLEAIHPNSREELELLQKLMS